MYAGKYEKSLCHAWGAGPIYLFGKYYLGVRPTAPGYATFEVRPQLGGLTEIEGTVPITGGTVTVRMDQGTLSVTASRAGGTLVYKDRRYALEAERTVTLAV